ncbi:MAG: acyltransferase [Chitinophagaceae bacterium]
MKYKNLSHTAYNLQNRILLLLGTVNRFRAKWWGVNIGNDTQFIGKCHFKRYPGTTIQIGTGCDFRSKPASNLIGINRPCILSTHHSGYKASIEIGNNCGFSGTVIGAFRSIKLGDNVRCGANTLITDSDWHLDDKRSGEPQEVIIGNNVWLGVNTVVLKGVTIGENTVIGANSVVTRSIPANVIAAGNPCKVIKSITHQELKAI